MTAASSPTPTSVETFFISMLAVRCSIKPNSPIEEISVLFSLILVLLKSGVTAVDHLDQLVMDLPVGGDDMRLVKGIRATGEIRDPPARLFHDQKTCRAIPGVQLMLIKPVKPARSHPAKIDCRRPKATDGDTPPYQTGKNFQRSIRLIQVGIGKTGDETGLCHGGLIADTDLPVVECGAIAPLCEKEFFDEGIVNGAKDHFTLLLHADRNATKRKTMREIHCSVYRVDDPLIAGVHLDGPGFFAKQEVIGKIFSYYAKDGFLRSMIGFRNQVVDTFLVGYIEVTPEIFLHDRGAGFRRPDEC